MPKPSPPSDALPARSAILAGGSGLVGLELVRQLLASSAYAGLHCLLRHPLPKLEGAAKLVQHQVSFDALPPLPAADDVYIALGTTLRDAGSEQAFRRVDYDYVLAVARAARASGATRLALVSALGADADSRVFYNRVKGEAERAVMQLGYESVVIAQPSLLLGDREALGQAPRGAERLARRLLGPARGLIPARFRPVHARDVAAALIASTLHAERGSTIIQSRQMHGAAHHLTAATESATR